MMQLCKALFSILYKEDSKEQQFILSERMAKIIRKCPTLKEYNEYNQITNSYIEEYEETSEEDNLQQIIQYNGFISMMLQAQIETFIREYQNIDSRRADKYKYYLRQIITEAFIYVYDKQQDQAQYLLEVLDKNVFNIKLINQMIMPRNLTIHVIRIYNSIIRKACKNEQQIKQILLPIIIFYNNIKEESIQKIIQDMIFNDFTDCNYKRSEAIGRLLSIKSKSQNIQKQEDLLNLCLYDFILYLSAQNDNKVVEQFGFDIQEYVEFFNTKDYDKYSSQNQQEQEVLKNKEIISQYNVEIAKKLYGKDFKDHIYKQDGILQVQKENVRTARLEDDYLPKKYRYLEAEQRDVGDLGEYNEDDVTGITQRLRNLIRNYNEEEYEEE